MNILVPASGGRSSMAMAYKIKNSEIYENNNIVFVYSNTGKERKLYVNFGIQWILIWD